MKKLCTIFSVLALCGCATMQRASVNPYADPDARDMVACFNSPPGGNPIICRTRYSDVQVVGRVAEISPVSTGPLSDSSLIYVDSGPARSPNANYDVTGALSCVLLVNDAKNLAVNDRVTLRGAFDKDVLLNQGYRLGKCVLVKVEHPPFPE
jgi:hypothetical protein